MMHCMASATGPGAENKKMSTLLTVESTIAMRETRREWQRNTGSGKNGYFSSNLIFPPPREAPGKLNPPFRESHPPFRESQTSIFKASRGRF